MSANGPRAKRLLADYQKVLDLKARSDMFSFISEGTPPEKYTFNYTCKGMMLNPNTKKPSYTVHHQVEVYLHSNYPRIKPQMKWLTPIFHPNINRRNGTVCIDKWAASKSLDYLCIMFAEMIQYKNYNADSPLDSEAAEWAARNTSSFPVDRRPFLAAEVKINLLNDLSSGIKLINEEIEIKLL